MLRRLQISQEATLDPLRPLAPLNLLGGATPPTLSPFAPVGLAGARSLVGPTHPQALSALVAEWEQQQRWMGQLLKLLMDLMGGAASPGALGGAAGAGALGGAPWARGSTGSAAGAPSGGFSSPSAGPVSSLSSASPATSLPSPGPTSLKPGARVLQIGDSHTVGSFGEELDGLLRGAGAQVSTYAASGSSATTWAQGGTTSSGWIERRADGSVVQPPWNSRQPVPPLESLIAREKPEVLLVNLGANFRGASEGELKRQVQSLGEIARKHGVELVWVGPPPTREDGSNPSSLKSFDQRMSALVGPYGQYVPSQGLVGGYSGSDGIHYSGSEGTARARQWARAAFQAAFSR